MTRATSAPAGEGQSIARARRSIAARNPLAARAELEELLQHEPDNTQARLLLSGVLLDLHDLRAATAQLLAAAASPPDNPGIRARLARYLYTAGETVAARACLDPPQIEEGASASDLFDLGFVHQMMGDTDAALPLLERALDAGMDNADIHYFLGLAREFAGDVAAAQRHYETCLRKTPTWGRAALRLARLRRSTPQTEHVEAIRSALPRVRRGSIDHASFEFALYEELDGLGRHDQAWPALVRANAVMASRNPYDAGVDARLDAAITGLCTREFLSAPERAPHADGPVPIFIIGLPRSGTTLLERILGNHSQVAPGGELMEFFRQLRWTTNVHGHRVADETVVERAAGIDYGELGRRYLVQTRWRAQGRPFYVDKLPVNFQIAGLIHKALPHAPILHMVREAVAVCFSNFKAMFSDACAYSYDLQSLAGYHRRYRALMEHWRAAMPGAVLDVSYADLVRDPAATARAVLDFCGLPFEPQCIDTTRGSTPVSTLSSSQVRQAIHTQGLDEWRRYAEVLAPLREALR
jgi:tetratricopeptide (TPR) repeat protein